MAPLWHDSPHEVTVIRQITPLITTVSVPFARFGLIKFGGRATITKLESGSLFVFSPVDLTDDVKKTVSSLGGNVQYLVAPDMEHHMKLGAWKKEYPQAKIIAPSGLREKRAKQKDEDIQFDYEFSAENKRTLKLPEEIEREFDVEFFDAHSNKEIVFNHRPSKTLIQADLLFNLPAHEQYSKANESYESGIFAKIAMIFASVGKGQQRFQWYIASAGNRPGFNESVRRTNSWNFDRIVPCHGEVIESNGKSIFQQVFAWHLEGQK